MKQRLVLLLLGLTTALSAAPGPKNVIVMISDGGGFNHYAAGALYRRGQLGQGLLDRFPVKLAMSTYSSQGHGYDPPKTWADYEHAKLRPTDSAAAATTLSSGVKTYNAAIGVDPDKKPVKHLLERAEELGKKTGVVSSVPISHATPAGFVAHNASRSAYAELGREMITASAADVIVGAGHPLWDSNGGRSAKPKYDYVGGQEVWEAVIAGQAGADADGDGRPDPWTLVETKEGFEKLAKGPAPKRLLGLAPAGETLQAGRKRGAVKEPFADPLLPTVPSLATLSRAALNVLDDDPDGLFLMIEGGAVDWAAHSNYGWRVIEEIIDFEDAIAAVVEWVEANSSWDETLLVITSDHETGGLTGPGEGWPDLVAAGQGKQPEMVFRTGGHTNSLVPFFARGAGSERYLTLATKVDPRRGCYLDNTDVAQTIFALWK